jgi:hypothetical protein
MSWVVVDMHGLVWGWRCWQDWLPLLCKNELCDRMMNVTQYELIDESISMSFPSAAT